MFNLQYSALKKSVGDETAGILADCEAELNHQGPVEFGGPVKFDQPPIGIAPNYIEGILTEDLSANHYITQIYNGQLVSKNNLISQGRDTTIRLSGRAIQETFTIPAGARFGAAFNGLDWCLLWPLHLHLYIEGTLSDDLVSDGALPISLTWEGIPYNTYLDGKAVRSGKSIPSGSRYGARWNGSTYTVIWVNVCDV